MNFNNQDEKNQNGGMNQESPNNPYGNYMPQEIPIPDTGSAKETGESPYGQNNPYQPQNLNPAYGPQYMPQKPKRNLTAKILIAVASAVVIVFAAVGIGMAYFRSTPAYRLGKAFQNLNEEMAQITNPLTEKIGIEDLALMMAEEGSHMSTQINFTSESMFGTTFGIDTEYYKDMEHKELSADTNINLMNYDFAHLNIYADEEAFCFSIPELFIENMYIDNENVMSQYNRSFLAEMSGISEAEDFSIDLFTDAEERLSLRDWQSMDGYAKRYAEDIEACREKMVMEKAEKGVYRIVCPGREMDRLLQDMMDNYEAVYEMAGEDEWWKEYDRLIDSDISMLFEINGQNHIESITFEEPVALLDGMASMDASLYFLGSMRSIDKMQGEINVAGEDGVERSVHLQILQTPSEDAYTFDMDIELTEDEDSLLRMKYVSNSDAARDEFDVSFSMWNDEEDIELALKGGLDDIVIGRSLDLELEEMTFNMDGEELFKITGDLMIEPFEGEVTSSVQKETAFFEMTEDDWYDILYEIDDAYGGILNYLWY